MVKVSSGPRAGSHFVNTSMCFRTEFVSQHELLVRKEKTTSVFPTFVIRFSTECASFSRRVTGVVSHSSRVSVSGILTCWFRFRKQKHVFGKSTTKQEKKEEPYWRTGNVFIWKRIGSDFHMFFFLIYALFDICPKIISNVLNFLGHLGHLS